MIAAEAWHPPEVGRSAANRFRCVGDHLLHWAANHLEQDIGLPPGSARRRVAGLSPEVSIAVAEAWHQPEAGRFAADRFPYVGNHLLHRGANHLEHLVESPEAERRAANCWWWQRTKPRRVDRDWIAAMPMSRSMVAAPGARRRFALTLRRVVCVAD
jgi:hypothetical protein